MTTNNVRGRVFIDTMGKHTRSTFIPTHLADNGKFINVMSHNDDTNGNHARRSRPTTTHNLPATITIPTVKETKTTTIHNGSRTMAITNEQNQNMTSRAVTSHHHSSF
jgi:hypothetical protein